MTTISNILLLLLFGSWGFGGLRVEGVVSRGKGLNKYQYHGGLLEAPCTRNL